MYACRMELFKRSLVCVSFPPPQKKNGVAGRGIFVTYIHEEGIGCMQICYVLKTLRSRTCVSVFTESINLCIFYSMAHFGNVC